MDFSLFSALRFAAAQMREGDTPLIDAARHGRAADVVALLADGADVNEPKTDGSGATALFIASQEGHTEVVTILIDAVVQAPPERLPDPVRGVGGVRDAAHGHARLQADDGVGAKRVVGRGAGRVKGDHGNGERG